MKFSDFPHCWLKNLFKIFITCLYFILASQQPTDAATKRIADRREMLQRYKEEKELRKLIEQREKAKKGVFKVGLYRPAAPGFLSHVTADPVTVKPREKVIIIYT